MQNLNSIMTQAERNELQPHLPYMGLKLNELSIQEERLVLFYLKGMSKAAAGRAAGYQNMENVYAIFKKEPVQKAITYLRKEMVEECKFDKNTATNLYFEAHRKSANATEEKNIVDSLCKLHGLFIPDNATQININLDKVEQLERLSDDELVKLAGKAAAYLEPAK